MYRGDASALGWGTAAVGRKLVHHSAGQHSDLAATGTVCAVPLASVAWLKACLSRAQGRAKLQEVSHLKEAEQLLRSMLTFKPKGRPSMRAVMSHPFWWPPHQRLSFLIDMSDRMENEDREVRLPPALSSTLAPAHPAAIALSHARTLVAVVVGHDMSLMWLYLPRR